jgi:hypothetical protein
VLLRPLVLGPYVLSFVVAAGARRRSLNE